MKWRESTSSKTSISSTAFRFCVLEFQFQNKLFTFSFSLHLSPYLQETGKDRVELASKQGFLASGTCTQKQWVVVKGDSAYIYANRWVLLFCLLFSFVKGDGIIYRRIEFPQTASLLLRRKFPARMKTVSLSLETTTLVLYFRPRVLAKLKGGYYC